MPHFRILLFIGTLAIGPAPARPADYAGTRDSSVAISGAAAERALPKSEFREFLREIRSSEDSLHYRQGEIAFEKQEFDLALSHHLAAGIPDAGALRSELLAQRSRIFARLWPAAVSRVPDRMENADSNAGATGPTFDWGVGAEHSRGMDRAGPILPYGADGFAAESRDWIYRSFARRCWPVSVGETRMSLGLSAIVSRSSLGAATDYEAALEAEMQEGMLEDVFLSFSGGLEKTREWGARRFYGWTASKTWYFHAADAAIEAGYSRHWDGAWNRLDDNAWAKADRDIPLMGESLFHVSLEVAAAGRESPTDRFTLPVRVVNDVARSGPSLFQDPEPGDPPPEAGSDPLIQSESAIGERTLTIEAPLSCFSLSPAFRFAFPVPAGLQAQAGAWYALEIYPEYAWDRIPRPDPMDPYSGDLAGLAWSRADGRYYPALLAERNGEYRESIGTAPMEQVKTRRVDNRVGLDFRLGRDLPQGYSLSLGSTLDLGWTNLGRTAPAAFRPWQWGMALNLSRSLSR